MVSAKSKLSTKHALSFKSNNKLRRRQFHLKQKRARDNIKRDERFNRKRVELKNPALREARLSQNTPVTIDSKRTWDDFDGGKDGNILGLAVDVARFKRQKLNEDSNQDGMVAPYSLKVQVEDKEMDDEDTDSMLESDSGSEAQSGTKVTKKRHLDDSRPREATSLGPSLPGVKLDLNPDALIERFPSLFNPPSDPKVLITTSLNSTLHDHAKILTETIPNSVYIRRTSHRYGHKYSIREISQFAAKRGYTTVVILNEDQKKPCGLDVVHLPVGPMFHFSITNWVEGKKLPGHGNSSGHAPELILNNFKTPLGLLTAHLFRTLFPIQPELVGRQVVTLHNQRDYIFFRRHRYVFRNKRATEKTVTGMDGKAFQGVEGIKAGLQELGPRFTMKLRRIDKGIQNSSGQEWRWKAGDEKVRTRFAL